MQNSCRASGQLTVQCANSYRRPLYFAARFHRLAAKRGSKRAIVAIGHKILVLAHYLLQHNCPFRELGADYYQRLRAPSLSQSLVRRLQRLGYEVTLAPAQHVM
jgi:transposase